MGDGLQTCPHCGAPLPSARDAFCSECRNPIDEPPRPARGGPSPTSRHASAGEPGPDFFWTLLPFNAAGFVIVAVSFLPILGLCRLRGEERDAVVLAIGGPVALALDLAYRLRFSGGDLVSPNRGGKFLWLPLWGFGVFWLVYGLWQLLTGANN